MEAPKCSQSCANGAEGWQFLAAFRRLALVLVASAFLAGGISLERGGVSFGVAPAAAQSAAKGKRKTLLQAIFGQRKAKRRVVKTRKAKRKATRKVRRKKVRRQTRQRKAIKRGQARKASPKRASSAALAQPTEVSKSEIARIVLVAGDFYAGSLADGLKVAFKDNPDVVVVDKSNGLSGFVRTDIVNWPEAIGPLVGEVKPDYLIFMAGSNDRQLLREDGVKYEKLTPGWETAYRGRISSMGEALATTKVPFTWVGLPSVRFSGMSRDFVNFNEWYSAAASKSVQGKFTDVWDGFADANGNYSRSGPDINGQIAVLRRKDGINMTNAGKRRLAFYVESDIRRMVEGASAASNSAAGEFDGIQGLPPQEAVYDPAETGRTVVVNLNDPSVDGADMLAGAPASTAAGGGDEPSGKGAMNAGQGADASGLPVSSAHGVKTAGSSAPGTGGASGAVPARDRVGRADDFSWPPREPKPPELPGQAVSGGAAKRSSLR